MWTVANETPFKTDRTIVVDKHGARHWVVVVKATFAIHPDGGTEIAKKQVDPLLVPEYRGEPGESSLLYESDLVSDKPGTDVLVHGTAYAPRERPATEVRVALKVGDAEKTLVVRGDRVFERTVGGVAVSQPSPFLKMPLVYERAYGGFDHASPDPARQKIFAPNPVGTGVSFEPASLVGRPVANVEFETGPSKPSAAAGFGPLCSYWEPRRRYAGTYDDAWAKKQKPLLPLDFDDRGNMCAPIDQQVEPHARGGEVLHLTHLTPAGAMTVRLPRHYFTFTTLFARSARRSPADHRARLHTVIVEPDQPRLIMVWHSRLSCGNAVDDIDQTIVGEKEYVS
jgi:hypothetical protein